MKKDCFSLLNLWVALLFCLLLVREGNAQTLPSFTAKAEFVPREFLVRLKPQTGQETAQGLLSTGGAKVTPLSLRRGWYLVQYPHTQAMRVGFQTLTAHLRVTYIEPNYVYRASITPNDPQFLPDQWNLRKIRAESAWSLSSLSDRVVAIVDSGIDYNHEDLKSNLFVNPAEVAGNGIDDDGNGVVDDIHGANFFVKNGNPLDDNGHGTHVSGIVGAVGNNGLGVSGVCWGVPLLAVKFLNANGAGSLSGAVGALNYVADMKQAYQDNNGTKGANITVVNASWGSGADSQALKDAIQRLSDLGILFVAAAGNSGSNNDVTPVYPSSYALPNVLAVAATTAKDALATFSNFGQQEVDLAAPGVGVLSTYLGNTYATLNGTSMAAPHVTGAVALLAGYHPEFTMAQIRDRILQSVDKTSRLTGKVQTGGRLNLLRALDPTAKPQLISQISTDKPKYRFGEMALLSVFVRADYDLVKNTYVDLAVTTPNGTIITQQHSTESKGQTTFQFSVLASYGIGKYKVAIKAHRSGYILSRTKTSFTAK